jgi:hypothetical protein
MVKETTYKTRKMDNETVVASLQTMSRKDSPAA